MGIKKPGALRNRVCIFRGYKPFYLSICALHNPAACTWNLPVLSSLYVDCVKRIFIIFFCYLAANVVLFFNNPNFYNNL